MAARRAARPRGRRRSRDSRPAPRAAAAVPREMASGTAPAATRCSESTPESHGTESGSDPWVTSTRRPRATSVAAGDRPTNEKRLQRSPCSTDSSRKPGPSPTTDRKAPDRGQGVRDELSPDRNDRVITCQLAEALEVGAHLRGEAPGERSLSHARPLLRTGAGHAGGPPNRRWKQVQSPVWQAPRPSWSTVMSTASPSQSYAADRTHWRSPEVSPLHQYSWRLRLQNHVRPLVKVRRSASASIQPSISTSQVVGILHDRCDEPVLVETDLRDLFIGESHRRSAHRYNPVRSSRRSDATAGMSRSRRIK